METEEIIKVVNGIYKNILENFNPGARQMINAGKVYLKTLHDAAAASRIYVDAISKLAQQAQMGTWGGSSDIGTALMKIVDVYKEIQDQHVNILKAFYVDLLVPLETNLEKDTKVIQSERKRFLQQHKQRLDTYMKTTAMMKKQRKKVRGSAKNELAMDKELKNMKILEEEKSKLDLFYEQSLKNAMTQERRRYGFVLERQCSLSKHYLSYYTFGMEAYANNIEKWLEVAKTREILPKAGESLFSSRKGQTTTWQDDDVYANPRNSNFEEDTMSMNSQLRKTKSVDASCLDIRSMQDAGSPVSTLYRARSEYNLKSSTHSPSQEHPSGYRRQSNSPTPSRQPWHAQIVRALYAYLSSGENQLSFHEGDLIALIGERNKGWQFGENLRTQCTGWFPLAYTEIMNEPILSPVHVNDSYSSHEENHHSSNHTATTSSGAQSGNDDSSALEQYHAARMFGDSLHRLNASAKQIRRAVASNNSGHPVTAASVPPPTAPAPEPNRHPHHPKTSTPHNKTHSRPHSRSKLETNENSSTPHHVATAAGIKMSLSAFNLSTSAQREPNGNSGRREREPQQQQERTKPGHGQEKGGPASNMSLHGSNDSGFSTDPRQQPEVDYSDDELVPNQKRLSSRRKILRQIEENNNTSTNLRKSNTLKQARSHVNLLENKVAIDDDTDIKDRAKMIKRSKSFWKFGKQSSSTEILEGMALWKHKDLIDVKLEKKKKKAEQETERATSDGDTSDSDTIINNNTPSEKDAKIDNKVKEKRMEKSYPVEDTNDDFDVPKKNIPDYNKCFHEDDDDGLMLKTINRKNIVQQYANSSSGSDSGSESDVTTDDPYDCIIVDDQKITKKSYFPNVSELGRKLEEFSKYTQNNKKNMIQEKNNVNRMMYSFQDNDVIPYGEKRNTFKTFHGDDQDVKQQKQMDDNTYYNESTLKRNEKEYHGEWKLKNKIDNNRKRSGYESIDSDGEQRKYYSSNEDGLSDNNKHRQSLTRNKSSKRNQSQKDYDDDTLKQRNILKNGNMYGPWYDLWGLDSTGEIAQKQ